MAPYSAEESGYWMKYADELDSKGQENVAKATESEKDRLAKIEAEKAKVLGQNDLTDPDNIKAIASGYRNNKMLIASPQWTNLTTEQRQNTLAEMNGQKKTLEKTDLGKGLIGSIEEQTPNAIQTAQETTQEKPKIDADKVRQDLKGMALDVNPKDGVIDNIEDIKFKLNQIISASGLGDTDPNVKSLRSYIEELETSSQKKFNASEERRLESKQDIKSIQDKATAVTPIYGVYRRLKENPTDEIAVADAMNRLLRDESGAAIGKDEVLSRMQTVLPKDAYEELASKLGGVSGLLAKYFDVDELLRSRALNQYFSKVDRSKLKNVLRDRIGNSDVFNYLEKNYKTDSSQSKNSKTGRVVVKDPSKFFGGK
jgi:hypothetical protein